MVKNTTARTRRAAALAAAASIALISQGVVPAQAEEGGPTCRWVCTDAEGNPIDDSNCNAPDVPHIKPGPGGCQPGGDAGEGNGEQPGKGTDGDSQQPEVPGDNNGQQPVPQPETPGDNNGQQPGDGNGEQPGKGTPGDNNGQQPAPQPETPGDNNGKTPGKDTDGNGKQPEKPGDGSSIDNEGTKPGAGSTIDNEGKKPGDGSSIEHVGSGTGGTGSTADGGLKTNLDAVLGSTRPGGSSLADNPRCAAALAGVGLPLAALVPLGLGSKVQLPGVNNLSAQLNAQARNLNNDIQRGIGVHDPRLSQQASQLDNQLKTLGADLGPVAAGAGTVALSAAALGAIAYACSPQAAQGSSAEGSSLNLKKDGNVTGWGKVDGSARAVNSSVS